VDILFREEFLLIFTQFLGFYQIHCHIKISICEVETFQVLRRSNVSFAIGCCEHLFDVRMQILSRFVLPKNPHFLLTELRVLLTLNLLKAARQRDVVEDQAVCCHGHLGMLVLRLYEFLEHGCASLVINMDLPHLNSSPIRTLSLYFVRE
jgi:hypothetical protein